MSVLVGQRRLGQNSTCEVIVVKAPLGDGILLCAGQEMLTEKSESLSDQPVDGPTIALGKRYVEDNSGIEVLCAKSGVGPLEFGGHELVLKTSKPLPASD